MTRSIVSLFAGLLFLGAGAVSAAQHGGPAMPAGEAGNLEIITATVTAVDLDAREVTVKGPEGREVVIVAGPEVRNLAQVKVGDKLVFEYFESLALALTPVEGQPAARMDTTEVARAPKGAKPGGVIKRTVEAQGKVEAIDTKNRVVTLRGAKNTLRLKVADDVDLGAIKIGQNVVGRYVEAMAISVHAPKGK